MTLIMLKYTYKHYGKTSKKISYYFSILLLFPPKIWTDYYVMVL